MRTTAAAAGNISARIILSADEHFALAGTCEHEQCLRAVLQPNFNLHVEGQTQGGRGHKKGGTVKTKAPAKPKEPRGRGRRSVRTPVIAGRKVWHPSPKKRRERMPAECADQNGMVWSYAAGSSADKHDGKCITRSLARDDCNIAGACPEMCSIVQRAAAERYLPTILAAGVQHAFLC